MKLQNHRHIDLRPLLELAKNTQHEDTIRRIVECREAKVVKMDKIKALATSMILDHRRVAALIEGRTNQVDMELIEKVCDFLAIEPTSLFATSACDFWAGIRERGTYSFTYKYGVDQGKGLYDEYALLEFRRFMTQRIGVDNAKDESRCVPAKLPDTGDIFAFGLSKGNEHTEHLLCEAFGATPYDTSSENRKKLPFRFALRDAHLPRPGAVCVPAGKGPCGIINNRTNKTLVEVEWYEDFSQRIPNGLDASIIVASKRQQDPSRWLVVMAGHSGIGTVAATKVFCDHFRRFDATGNEPAWAVYESKWKKPLGDTDNRKMNGRPKFIAGSGPRMSRYAPDQE